jgi:hypothetical protein
MLIVEECLMKAIRASFSWFIHFHIAYTRHKEPRTGKINIPDSSISWKTEMRWDDLRLANHTIA